MVSTPVYVYEYGADQWRQYDRAMSHEEETYPNPEMFIPGRFLRGDGTLNEDNVSYIFGFGRRIWCVHQRANDHRTL